MRGRWRGGTEGPGGEARPRRPADCDGCVAAGLGRQALVHDREGVGERQVPVG